MNVSWPTLLSEISACQRCRLCTRRTRVVPGEGDPHAALLLIGEGPGYEEDISGRPFVGAAGQLLDKIIGAIGLSRGNNVYIANVVKCRPPGNRAPEADEVADCLPFLRQQVALIRPKVIVLMGASAYKAVLGGEGGITRARGQMIERKGVFFLPTFHPAALLRDETKKRPVWEDFKQARDKLMELNVYEKQSGSDS